MTSKTSLYFRHCEKATLNPVEGVLKGSIPEWLEGTLIRNGPGIQEIGPDRYQHVFDALAVLHRIHIANGKATYNSRPLESRTYKKNMAASRIIVDEFGTTLTLDPCSVLFDSLKTDFVDMSQDEKTQTDSCAVNIVYHGDQCYAMTETECTRRIDPKTLLPIGDQTVISDYVAINSASAHPHVLPNGNVVNMGQHYSNKNGPHYAFFEVPPKYNSLETSYINAKTLGEIPVTGGTAPSYFHSFGITHDKIIFVESPLRVNMEKLATKDKSTTFKDTYHWHAGEKTRFLLSSLHSGDHHPIVYETDELFLFHHINAYEEDGHLVVDVAGYDSGRFITHDLDRATVDKISNSGGSGRRYVLPLEVTAKSGNLVTLKNTSATAFLREGTSNVIDVNPQIFYPTWLEFPRINYKFNGSKYKFIYGVAHNKQNEVSPGFPEPNVLVKVNMDTGDILTWAEENVITPEPIFVANPTIENPSEDDGVLLIPLLYEDDFKKITLLILDAKNLKEICRTDFTAEGNVTSTFHGQWANEKDRIHLY